MKKNIKKLLLILSATVLLCASMCILASAADTDVTVATAEAFHKAVDEAGADGWTKITLDADIEITKSVEINGGKKIEIIGNGHEIDVVNITSGHAFVVTHGGAASQLKFNGVTVTSTGTAEVNAIANLIFSGTQATVTLDGGTVIKNIPRAVNSIIHVEGGNLVMNNARVENCTSTWWGIVTVYNAADTAVIDGATFSNCDNKYGVIYSRGTLNVKSVTIENMKNTGPAIRVAKVDESSASSVTLESATIRGTTSGISLSMQDGVTATIDAGFADGVKQAKVDDNTYADLSVTSVAFNKSGTVTCYATVDAALQSLSESAGNKETQIITLLKDGECATRSNLYNRRITIEGNDHKLTLPTGWVWGSNTDILFKNVTVKAKGFSVGDSGQVTFDQGSVLTTDNEETAKALEFGNTTKLTFKNGSKIKNVNCTTAVIVATGEVLELVIENGVTVEGTVTLAGNAPFIASAAKSNSINLDCLVAKINNDYYTGFSRAINCANGGTVTLLKDCSYDGGVNSALNYTLEGNNKKLTINNTYILAGDVSSNLSSTVVMKNVTVELAGTTANANGFSLYNSSLTLENVTLNANVGVLKAFSVEDGSTLTMNNTNVTATESAKLGAVVYTMTGTTFNATGSTFKNINFENKNDGTMNNDGAVIYANGGTISLKNCEISGNIGALSAGVSLKNNPIFTMENGEIKNNQAWCVCGIKKIANPAALTFKGTATVTDNKVKNSTNQANIYINTDVTVTLAADFTGKLGFIADSNNNSIAEGAQIGQSVTGTIKTAGAITADKTEFIGYIKDGKLTFIKKPTLTVNYDSGVYNKESATYGVVRALSTFSNVTEGTAIESCGTYFVKTIPSAGAVPEAENKKHVIENPTVSAGSGFMADCYEMPQDASVVAVSWYKLAGVNEYIYTIGAVKAVDTEKAVEYTEA